MRARHRTPMSVVVNRENTINVFRHRLTRSTPGGSCEWRKTLKVIETIVRDSCEIPDRLEHPIHFLQLPVLSRPHVTRLRGKNIDISSLDFIFDNNFGDRSVLRRLHLRTINRKLYI